MTTTITAETIDSATADDFAAAAVRAPRTKGKAIKPEDVVTEEQPTVDEPRLVDHVIDQRALDDAGADPDPWAREFCQLIGHTTGQWIDEGTVAGWFSAYGARVQSHTFRTAAFLVANTTLPASVSGDSSFLLLQLRDQLTASLKARMGQ